MKISLVIPTYRRVNDLRGCLAAVAKQNRPADEVLVVTRIDDAESNDAINVYPDVHAVHTSEPGVIAAMNAGVAAARGELIALTDDDAAPRPEWLDRIEKHFAADQRLGALGGKDWQYKGDPLALDDGNEPRAGEMEWWGRVIGQHHWASAGRAREVAVIKGVNCAFRATALRQIGGFDTRLAGTGAQVHWELSACLAMKRVGWKVVFDPSIGVDHFPATRFDEDQRGRFVGVAQQNAVANETLVLLEHFGAARRFIFLTWAIVLGTRGSPGVLQVPRLLLLRQRNVLARFAATMRGRAAGVRMFLEHGKPIHSAAAPTEIVTP